MTDDPNAFSNFDPDKADKLLALAEEICIDEIDAAAHLAASLMSIVPNSKHALVMLGYVELKRVEWEEQQRH